MSSPEHTFVFVGGLHRSGTSVLGRSLAAHPLVSGFSGTGVPEDEGQHLQSVFPAAKEHGGAGRFGFDPASHLTEDSPLATPENAATLLEEWSRHWDMSRPYLLEKSPPNLVRTRFLQALYPRSRFVMVIRDPIVVAGATRKWSHTSEITLIEHWLACHEQLVEDAPHVNGLVLVRYEELTSDPQRVLVGVFESLGLEPPADAGKEIRRSLNDPYFEAWERRRSAWWRRRAYDRGVDRLEARVRRFGYSLSNPGEQVQGESVVDSLAPAPLR
jgi:hypothetical protein